MSNKPQKPTQTARKTRQGQLDNGALLDGRYRVHGVLGRGGFSSVYDAEQIQVGRRVAVKVLDLGLDVEEESTAVARFLQEARTAARLEHPNVVALYDAGVLGDGRPFMVLQRFQGSTLKSYIRKSGPMAAKRALPLFLGCLDAVAKAHQEGIVHRDLKPSNLVLTDPGERTEALKVIDFGIAHLQLEQSDLTQQGALIGTVAYLAPEYILEYKVTPALDVYQLGLVLIELLTGQRAVKGEHPLHFAMGHSKGLVEMPESLRTSPLGPVLERATARGLEERYPDAQAFRDALELIDANTVPVFVRSDENDDDPATTVWDGSSGTLALTTGELEPMDTQLRAALPPATPTTVSQVEPRPVPAPPPQQRPPAAPRSRGLAVAIGTVGIGLLAIAAVLLYTVLQDPGGAAGPIPAAVGTKSPTVPAEPATPAVPPGPDAGPVAIAAPDAGLVAQPDTVRPVPEAGTSQPPVAAVERDAGADPPDAGTVPTRPPKKVVTARPKGGKAKPKVGKTGRAGDGGAKATKPPKETPPKKKDPGGWEIIR